MGDRDEKTSARKDSSDEDKTRTDSEVSPSGSELTLEGVEDEGNCGYGSCEPKFLRCCNNAKGFLVVYCFLVIVQGM